MSDAGKLPGGKSNLRRGGGRPKGAQNKTTVAVKEALQAVFEGMGGVKRMQAWAETEPTEFYKLYAKLLPTEVKAEHTGAGGGPLVVSWQPPAE